MLKIGYLLICEDTYEKNGKIMIDKPLPNISPLSLPGNYSFKVAFSLHNFDVETFGSSNKIQITFKDPEGKIIMDTGEKEIRTDLGKQENDSNLEVAQGDLTMNNVELYIKGIYTLTLRINEESKDLQVPVIERPKQGD
ncbi:hypothetical protein SAMN05421734_102251 [Pelagirhabdus alkalitolerans]|uniref:Uncharacterized protein n=1 Tax=Pelagirhabdus alkalitolerans TaxID=1612202 RepID=A0A1G6H550_9BACI|nr:hypothetical protein [Pelagirhabdus alkalitolerans]SDB89420.1 hypothetical protein SAMN05421734_102251 [Pelagirhabdus alkalitolerans]